MMNGLGYEPVECLQVPKVLFRDPEYRRMSVDAKVLYALLLDRMNVAAFNGWIDDYGTRYVIYPKSEMKKDLNATRYRVDMALEELYQKEKMVVVTQPYPGKPCQIYVKDITGKNEEDNKEMKKMMTQDEMKELLRKESEENYDDKVVLDQEEFDEILKIEGSLGRLEGLREIFSIALGLMHNYSGHDDNYFGLGQLKEVLCKYDEDADVDMDCGEDFESLIAGKKDKQHQEEGLEKEVFRELFARKLIKRNGKPDRKTIRRRSTKCAISFVSVLADLDEKEVMDGERLVEMLCTMHEGDDYVGVYDVLYVVKEVVNWGFPEMQDFEWIQKGGLLELYIDGFMNALNQEIFDTEVDLDLEDYEESDEEEE